jgi:hypothetical protein
MSPIRLVLLHALTLGVAACAHDAGEDDETESDTHTSVDSDPSAGVPSGASACYAAVLSKQDIECSVGAAECGPLSCEIQWNASADRCETISCVTDQDCERAYGDLCADEQWVCEAHITGDNRRCNVRDASSGSTGTALCDAIQATDGCGSEHVDRCVQGWDPQKAEYPECAGVIDELLACFESSTITCLRDADVSVGLDSDPNSPWTSPEGRTAYNAFGVLWYVGEPCSDRAQAWESCIYDGPASDTDPDPSGDPADGCPTQNDNYCDEGLSCEWDTDPDDCYCPWIDDGVCDELTGACPVFSDLWDCYCEYADDGQCDEPEGTGYCLDGTDWFDCP